MAAGDDEDAYAPTTTRASRSLHRADRTNPSTFGGRVAVVKIACLDGRMRCASRGQLVLEPELEHAVTSSTTKNVHRSCRSTTCSWMNSIIRPGVRDGNVGAPAFLSSRAISHFPAPPGPRPCRRS